MQWPLHRRRLFWESHLVAGFSLWEMGTVFNRWAIIGRKMHACQNGIQQRMSYQVVAVADPTVTSSAWKPKPTEVG